MNTRKRALSVITVTSVLIIILGFLNIYLNITVLATKGIELQKLIDEKDKWQGENSALVQEIQTRKSLGFINDEARKAGFTDPEFYILKIPR